MQTFKWFFIIFLFFSASLPAAGQESAPSQRYENIMAGNTVVALFDKETLRYEKATYQNEQLLGVWIKTFPSDNDGSYNLNRYLFRLHEREMILVDTLEYSSNGELLRQTSHPYTSAWTRIFPETVSEAWYIAVTQYAKNNAGKLQKEYKERMNGNEKNNRNVFSVVANFLGI
ncbi:hypothetical protein [Sporomusa sphaeroides]|uniref:hypothetical protein n=1 Tax=Sporomusa sphaeroides TaxID=47679 RepID=UPI002C5D1ECD|nr:hypothetical protein [Sporomusa sphaeroides]HML33860.1 hypothetical protein [Sporomusa sphaeroides]